MDLLKAIAELRTEKARLDRAIEALEESMTPKEISRARVWSPDARRAAAARMRKFWADRRNSPSSKSKASGKSASEQPSSDGQNPQDSSAA